jgi:RHS repeat-associated protein
VALALSHTPRPQTVDEAITNFTYDEVGNLLTVEDPRGKVTTYGYDNRNRQTSVRNDELNETNSVEYDPVSNKKKETRPDGFFRSWDYDAMNRLKRACDWRMTDPPLPTETTTYDRDQAGNVQFITDTKGAVYGFEYDALNRKTKATYPVAAPSPSPAETWHYDIGGNMDLHTNPDQKHRNFHYDTRNRPDHSWWDGGVTVGPDVVTAYDYASRVMSVVTKNAQGQPITTVAFGYDEANRKIWEDQTLAGQPTRRVKTDLDQDGRRTTLQIVDPPLEGGSLVFSPEMSGSGFYSITYDYTERSQLKHIIGNAGEDWSFTYTYDASGNMTSRQADSNGRSSSTNCPNDDYDALNRPRTWEQSGPNGFHALSHYQYDQANREVATWREEDANRGERFVYDPTNQISSVAYNAQNVWTGVPQNATRAVTYAYTAGKLNRSVVTDTGNLQPTSYSPNLLNQYQSVGGISYSYDNNFNLTGTGGLFGTFDASNHLTMASNSGGGAMAPVTVAEFIYDGLDRCVKRTLNGAATVFIYDGWKPIAEWEESTPDYFQAWNVYGPGADEILLRQQGKYGYTRFQLDRHGNVSFLLDNDAALLEKYSYDLFGRPRISDAAGNVRAFSYYAHDFFFQGREYIYELGIYDYRHRFYVPALGRFLQTDPKGFDAGDMNLFRYCGDDPVDHSDPTGEFYHLTSNGNNSYTVRIPIQYSGSAATPTVIERFNNGIKSLSGTYSGRVDGKSVNYSLKVEPYTPTHWWEKTNIVDVRAGKGDGKFGKEMGSSKALFWYAEGARVFGRDISPENGARHSVGHFLRLPEGYNPTTSATYPGYEGNVMDWKPGGSLNFKQVYGITHPTIGDKAKSYMNFLGHSGYSSGYTASPGVLTGGALDAYLQTIQGIPGGGPQPGEGTHTVSIDKN